MIFYYLNKNITSNKSLYLCKKKKKMIILDISKNIQVNLIKIKYN